MAVRIVEKLDGRDNSWKVAVAVSSALRVQEPKINVHTRHVTSFLDRLAFIVGWRAILLIAIAIGTIDVEHIKSIRDGSLFLDWPRLSRYSTRKRPLRLAEWEWYITIICEELNLAPLVFLATHHARSGEESVVDGARADIGIAVAEVDIDDDKVVDMLHVPPDLWFCKTLFDGGTDKNVASGSIFDLGADVSIESKLSIRPFDFDLKTC